jgi:hypothetical protein
MVSEGGGEDAVTLSRGSAVAFKIVGDADNLAAVD